MSIANFNNDSIDSGQYRPGLLTTEPLQSNTVFVDHKDAIKENNPCDFIVNIGAPIFRARHARVTRVIVPKPNNISINNNRVGISHDDGVFYFDLTPGLYSPTSFINEFVNKVNAALAAIPSADTFTGNYDSNTRRVTFTSVSGSNWFFINDDDPTVESFQSNGGNFTPFQTFLSSANPAVVGATNWESGICGFLYTRYLTVHSSKLSQNEMCGSRTSDPEQPGNIIATVDLTGIYDDGDFDAGTNFGRNIRSLEVSNESSYISVLNRSKSVDPAIDIQVFDEYNYQYNDSLLDSTNTFNGLGVSIFMNFFF